jgi:hypothetical protein
MRKICRNLTALGALAGIALVGPIEGVNAQAPAIVFADVLNANDPEGNSIRRVGVDGVGLQTLIPTGGGVRGVDVDAAAGFIYWTDVDNFAVRRARFNGSQQQDLVTTGVAFPSAIRLHHPSGRMFWGDQTTEEIHSTQFDGTLDQVLAPTPFFRGLAIHPGQGRVYWTVSLTPTTGRILSSNLDGSDQQIAIGVLGPVFKPGNLAIDPGAGKIYWTDAVARFVRRANLDGSAVEDLFDATGIGSPKGITLDLPTGRIYWGQEVNDFDSGGFLFGQIWGMDIVGGGNVGVIATGLGSVNDLVVTRVNVCFADFNGDGSVSVQDIFDFLAAYFSSDSLADVNGDGSVSVQDIFDYLAVYFAGC